MNLDLQGKVVLVTGGSKGIGLACARAFAAEGARLALCSRSQLNLQQAQVAIPGALVVAADLGSSDAALAMLDEVESRVGHIDILVNSAGAARRSPPAELTPAAWRAAMDAKYFSYINVIDPLVKRMADRGTGVIVNIIGAGGKMASSGHIAGGAANAALMLVTAGLGAAYAGKGVRIVGISPGLTETDRVAEGMAATARMMGVSIDEARQRSVAALPMGRMARPEEVANMAVFVASGKATYLTGVTISMDGALIPTVV